MRKRRLVIVLGGVEGVEREEVDFVKRRSLRGGGVKLTMS